MTKLSDTQSIILAEASQRPDGNVLPLPGSLRGGAQGKVIGALLRRGLIEEKATESRQQPDAALNRIWRNEEDGRAVLLFITPAGLAAIGVESESTPEPEPDSATERGTEAGSAEASHDGGEAGEAPQPPNGGAQAPERAARPGLAPSRPG